MLRTITAFAALLLMTMAASAAFAIELTESADKRLSCPDLGNTHQCASRWEVKLSAAHPGLVKRTDSAVSFLLLDGSQKRFAADDPDSLVPVELLLNERFLAVWEQWSEGNTWWLLDRKSGALTEIFGYPLLSPDGSRFVAASTDLEANFSRTVLNVYSIGPSGLTRDFEAIGGKEQWLPKWGASSVSWRDDTTIVFRRQLAPNYKLAPGTEAVVLRDGAWRIEKAPA
ncbi:MAG: hypothetical protein QM773_12480 [Hyphomonadaceae bacterium]